MSSAKMNPPQILSRLKCSHQSSHLCTPIFTATEERRSFSFIDTLCSSSKLVYKKNSASRTGIEFDDSFDFNSLNSSDIANRIYSSVSVISLSSMLLSHTLEVPSIAFLEAVWMILGILPASVLPRRTSGLSSLPSENEFIPMRLKT